MRGKKILSVWIVVGTLKRTENFKSFLLDVNDIRGHAHIVTIIYDTKCILRSQFLSLVENEENKFTVKWPKSYFFFQSPFDFFFSQFYQHKNSVLNNNRKIFHAFLIWNKKFLLLSMLHFCPKISNLFYVPTIKQLTQQ